MNRFLQPQDGPAAIAHLSGGAEAPQISGTVSFFNVRGSALVVADVFGLPHQSREEAPCGSRIFGLHIHEGSDCSGPGFEATGGHFSPEDCPHPHHAGDLPPLFGTTTGQAYWAVLTDRFSIPDIIGRTVVVHSDPDDFMTQPSGHSGAKLACGVIRAL